MTIGREASTGSMAPQTHRAARVLLADSVIGDGIVHSPGWIALGGGSIIALGSGTIPAVAEAWPCEVERVGGVLTPGFVDIHSHGAAGIDFAADSLVDGAVSWHRSRGTTTMLASIATTGRRELLRQIDRLAGVVDDGLIAGVHLEGPWLSHERRGAHAEHLLRPPSTRELAAVTSRAATVRMVTIAPELPGALDAIRSLTDAGIVVAMGHTRCDEHTARAAIDAGVTVATHLFNGMPPITPRDAGPAGVALIDDRVTIELILDGDHLSRAATRLALGAGAGRIAVVSDSIAASGQPDGEYELAGSVIDVENGLARARQTGSLAGSTSSVAAGARRLLADFAVSWPALASATASTAADAIRASRTGRLAPGHHADLLVWKNGTVTGVMRRGRWV